MPDIGCSPNTVSAFDFFAGRGFSHAQAAGIIGNLQWESGLNPRLEVMDTNNKMSRGIAMWQPDRWQNLLAFAAGTGRDPWAFDTQLEFLWHELKSTPSFGLASLLATTTVDDATIVFQNKFEHPDPALAHTDKRIDRANNALACSTIRPPLVSSKYGVVAVAVGVGAVIAAVGYGIYKTMSTRELELPEPEPAFPPPNFRPRPWRP